MNSRLILLVFGFLHVLTKIDAKSHHRSIFQESDHLADELNQAARTIRKLRKFEKALSEEGEILTRSLPTNKINDEDSFESLRNGFETLIKKLNETDEHSVRAFKFEDSVKQPTAFVAPKRARGIDVNSIVKTTKEILDYLLYPKCSSSKSDQKKLDEMASKIEKKEDVIFEAAEEIEKLSESSPQSIEKVIWELEQSEFKNSIAMDANKHLITFRNLLVKGSDILYKILAFLSNSDIFVYLLPAIRALFGLHTVVINFVTIKLFCLIDSVDIPLGGPIKAFIKNIIGGKIDHTHP